MINGRRLNEDTYTVQLTDEEGRLHSLIKSDLREYTISTRSTMPSYEKELTREELDVVVYLSCVIDQAAIRFDRHIRRPRRCRCVSATSGLRARAQCRKESHNYLMAAAIIDAAASDANHPCEREEPQSRVGVSSRSAALAATPLVVDGIMYLTQRPNDIVALDAATGRVFWVYRYTNESVVACCGSNNRGVAILGELLYMGTLDAHLVAIDIRSGRRVWKTKSRARRVFSITVAPLALKDRIVVGVGGGEYGIRGYISA